MMAKEAFTKLVNDYEFNTVLDVGCGVGKHANAFVKAGKSVVGVDIRDKPPGCSFTYIKDSFYSFMLDYGNSDQDRYYQYFDCVWASHILEHQLDVGTFLNGLKRFLAPNGILAITVPPLKTNIVGGHVTLWNAGLLLYNVVLAGFDLKDAIIKTYGYNISLITRYVPAELPSNLYFDCGDIEKLAHLFPKGYSFKQSFDGNINNIGWL